MNRYVLLLLSTAILWSLGGVLIKSIDLAPMAIAGSRSLVATAIILIAMRQALCKISWSIVPGAIAYSATVLLFVIATKLTTAANAIFLQYSAPIYIALLSPWFLGERIDARDWVLVVTALFGIGLFFLDRLSLRGLSGVVAALASGLAFASLTLLMRKQKEGSPEAVLLLGNGMTFFIALPWMFPISGLAQNGYQLLVLGTVQLAVPYLMYSVAIRHVRALDAAVISIIEPILNPVWVMLATGERPSFWAVTGGIVVLGTSLIRSVTTSRKGASTEPCPPEA